MLENLFLLYASSKNQPVHSQSDQHVIYWLSGKYIRKTCYMQSFNILAYLCSLAGWIEVCLVANLEEKFSCDQAHLTYRIISAVMYSLAIISRVLTCPHIGQVLSNMLV